MNDLSLHIIDIMQNSLSAGAALVRLTVAEDPAAARLTITVADNGRGMTPEQVAALEDPFFTSRTTRRVGMGLPLYIQAARQGGGDVKIISAPGEGTMVEAWFDLQNIDLQPMGDLAGAVAMTVSGNPQCEFIFTYIYGPERWVFDTREVKQALDGMSLGDARVSKMLAEMIDNNIKALKK